MKLPSPSKKIWIVLFTLAVIGGLFLFYFKGYIPQRKASVNAEKIRAVERIAVNIESKKKDYIRNAQNIFSAYRHCDSIELLIRKEEKELKDTPYYDEKHETISKLIKGQTSTLYKCKVSRDSELKDLGLSNSTVGSEQIAMEDDSIYFNFKHSRIYSVALNSFINNTFSNQFDDLLLIRTFSKPISKVGRAKNEAFRKSSRDTLMAIVSYQTLKNKVKIGDFENVLNSEAGLQSIKPKEVNLGGGHYSMFPIRIKFQDYWLSSDDSLKYQENQTPSEEIHIEENWIICGLVKTANYEAQIKNIELSFLVFLMLGILFILIAMPLLKLLIMSSIERLKISNVWFVGCSIIVGTALLYLLLLFTNAHQGGKLKLNNELMTLASMINKNISNELNQSLGMLDSLESLDSQAYSKLKIDANLLRTKENKTAKSGSIIPNVLKAGSLSKNSNFNIFFNEAFWLDSAAKQKLTLTTHPQPVDRNEANLSHRHYFSDAINNSNLNSTFFNNKIINFSLQSIASNRNYTREVGIGIPVNLYKSIYVVGLATKLHAVMDPLLPPGYQFAITDSKGEVWFHSKKELNLQENFFLETGNSHPLETLIRGRFRKHIDITYHGQSCRAYITPIQGTQLSLIVFQDKTYYSEPYVHSLSHGLLLVGLLFLIMGITLILLFVSTFQPTQLKIKRFFLNWLRPRSDWLVVEHKEKFDPYGISVVVQALLFFYFVIFYQIFGVPVTSIVVMLTLPVYFLLFHYLLFEVWNGGKTTLFDSSAIWFSIGAFIILSLIHLIAFEYVGRFWETVFIEMGMVLLATIGVCKGRWILVILGENLQKYLNSNYRRYLTMLRLWLVTTTIIPVFFFYRISTEMQFEAWNKYELLQIARNTDERLQNYRKEFDDVLQLFDATDTVLFSKYTQYADRYGNYIQQKKVNRDTCAWASFPENKLADLVFAWHFKMTTENGGFKQAIFPKASDNWWYWQEKKSGDSIRIKYTDWKNVQKVYSSRKEPFELFRGEYTVFFLLAFAIAFLLAIKTIRVAVKLIFGLGLINRWDSSKNDYWIKHITLNTKLFLVGLPYSFKNDQLDKVRKTHSSTFKFEELDFGSILKQTKDTIQKNRIYIIRHFELSINNHKQNVDRYELLNEMVSASSIGIIISSSVQPSVIYDFYELAIDAALSNKDLKDRDLNIAEYKKYIRLWKNLLSGFTMEYSSLISKTSLVDSRNKIVDSELSFGSYLPSLRYKWSDKVEEKLKSEDFILEVEEHADTYYHALWNSFTDKEKYLLFDLAVDRYVNMRNLKLIRILMNKGVIVMEDSLRIMNRSFNNFIISSVNQEEQNKMDKEVSKSGTWDTVQLVLILTLVAVAIFISIAQKNWLEDFNALITAVAGVTALLLRFGGLFSGTGKNTSLNL